MQPKALHANCEACPLKDRPFVPPTLIEGGAQFSFVGEAPTQEEVTTQHTFTNRGGEVLRKLLQSVGMVKSKNHFTNAVLCHTEKDEEPNKQAVACCRPRLIAELRQQNAERVLALGPVASEALELGVGKITKERGKWFKSKHIDTPIKVTLSTNYVLFKGGTLPDLGLDLYRFANNILPEPFDRSFTLIDTHGKLKFLVTAILLNDKTITFDFETTSLNPLVAKVICLALTNGEETWVITEEVYDSYTDEIVRLFTAPFSKGIKFIAHNAKYDVTVLEQTTGIKLENYEDTMLLHYSIVERGGTHGLKRLAQDLLNGDDYEEELNAYKPSKKNPPKEGTAVRETEEGYAAIPPEVLHPYAAIDVKVTHKLYNLLLPQQHANHYDKLLLPVSKMLREVEQRGFKCDVSLLESTIKNYGEERLMLQDRLQELAEDSKFNPRSPLQLKNVFRKYGLPVVKLTPKGGESTDKDVIDFLRKQYPDNEFLGVLQSYRHLNKIMDSYLIPFSEQLQNGRLHPYFFVPGTETGRLSGGIWMTWLRPKTNKYAAVLRHLVIADEGYSIIVADLDQAELRVVTCEAQDENYRQVFNEGGDPHAITADGLFGPQWRELPDASEWRTRGKTIRFAILYGAGPKRIAEEAGVSETFAKQLIEKDKKGFPAIANWMERTKRTLHEQKYLETCFGRRRNFPLLVPENMYQVNKEGPNFIIQSIANELNFLTALEIKDKIQIHLLQHDAVIGQVKNETALAMRQYVSDMYTSVAAEKYSTYVPFTAEAKLGNSWADTGLNWVDEK